MLKYFKNIIRSSAKFSGNYGKIDIRTRVLLKRGTENETEKQNGMENGTK